MRLIYITDSHLANKAPVSRIDSYNETIFGKLRFCFEYCKDNGIKTVIHGGDLFHSYKIKEEVGIKFVDLLQQYDIRMYYLYGNHDVQGNNRKYVDKTALGFLKRYPQFSIIGDTPYEFPDGIILNGYDCSDTVPLADGYYWDPSGMYGVSPGKIGYKILVLHANIENTGPMIIKGVRKTSFVGDVETDANLVLCGHNHIGWKSTITTDTLGWEAKFVNPGSIARVNYLEAEGGFGPRLADIEIDRSLMTSSSSTNVDKSYWVTNIEYIDIPHVDVFDLDKIARKKTVVRNKQNFIESLEQFEKVEVMADNFNKVLGKIFDNPPKKIKRHFNPRVRKYLSRKIDGVMND